VGQSLEDRRDNVSRLATVTGGPLAIFLQEAQRGGPDWTVPGYVGYTGPEAGDGDNNRILVKKGVEVIDSGHVRVPGNGWEWNGNEKPMRVFVFVIVRWQGQVYVLICVHRIPNGPKPAIDRNEAAWNAEHRALVNLVGDLRESASNATYVLGGDWNAGEHDMPEYQYSLASLAQDIAAKMFVLHIDGFLLINGRMVEVEKLDNKFGSDGHRPVMGEVIAT
jgi:hypothetical protein